jgi:hypothetical protein
VGRKKRAEKAGPDPGGQDTDRLDKRKKIAYKRGQDTEGRTQEGKTQAGERKKGR